MKHLRKKDDVNYWKACRPGTIFNVSDSKFHRRQRRVFIQTAMAGVVGGIGLMSFWFVRSQQVDEGAANGQLTLASLDCIQVKNQLGEYVAAYQLDVDKRDVTQQKLIAAFEAHLSHCKTCPKMVAEALRQV